MKASLVSMVALIMMAAAIVTSIAVADQSEGEGGKAAISEAVGPGDSGAASNENHDADRAPHTKKITLTCIPEESGRVCSNRTASSAICAGYIAGSVTSQAFLSFNISGIPDGSAIEKVNVDMRRCNVQGDPFMNLGCLRVYPVFYDTLMPEAFCSGYTLGDVMRICSLSDLRNMQRPYPALVDALQNEVGSTRFQMRFQFDRRDTIFVGKSESQREFGQRTPATGKTTDFGEWKPCLPEEPKSQGGLGRLANSKDLLQFESVKLVVAYLPPEVEE